MSGRAIIGLTFLLLVAGAMGWLLHDVPGARTLSTRLVDHVTGRMDRLVIHVDKKPDLYEGNEVYTVENQAFALQGRVLKIEEGTPYKITVKLDPALRRRMCKGTHAVFMSPEWDLAWVLRTLVPPDLREVYFAKLREVWLANRSETLGALAEPLVEITNELGQIIRSTIPDALAQHHQAQVKLFKMLEEKIYQAKVAPALEREVISRVEERITPLVGEVASEIWDAIGVTDMLAVSWVATKDLVGAADKEEMSKRLAQLLERRAVPVLKRRGPELLETALDAARAGMQSPEMQGVVVSALQELLTSREFQRYVAGLFDTIIVKNVALRERLRAALDDPKIQEPLEALWKAAEPTLEEALEEVLTRPDREGMDHQLVRVLRHIVLKKDMRYIVLIPGPEDGPLLDIDHPLEGTLGKDR